MENLLYIVSLTYKKPLEEVEKYIKEHISFLDKYYLQNVFIFSGRKNPRNGGVILAHRVTRLALEEIIKEDPFNKHQIASYNVIEVLPTKYAKEFESFIINEDI